MAALEQDAQLIFRVSSRLKQEFESTCARLETTPSAVLRARMREFVLDNDPRQQQFIREASRVTLDKPKGNDPHVIDSVTGFEYFSDDPAQCLEARMTRLLRRKFEKRHPEVPIRGYWDMEAEKRAAWPIVKDPLQPPEARAAAYERIMKMHFSRSVGLVLSRRTFDAHTLHPGWEEYARHYLGSGMKGIRERIGAEAADILAAKYPPARRPHIVPGDSYWRVD